MPLHGRLLLDGAAPAAFAISPGSGRASTSGGGGVSGAELEREPVDGVDAGRGALLEDRGPRRSITGGAAAARMVEDEASGLCRFSAVLSPVFERMPSLSGPPPAT